VYQPCIEAIACNPAAIWLWSNHYRNHYYRIVTILLSYCRYRSARHHARRSPSTGGCHTHASHSHSSTPGNSPLHTPAGLLSPHRSMPTSHIGQTIVGSPHRLPTGSIAAAGNGGSPTSQSVPTPAPALANVGIELNEVQPGEFTLASSTFLSFDANLRVAYDPPSRDSQVSVFAYARLYDRSLSYFDNHSISIITRCTRTDYKHRSNVRPSNVRTTFILVESHRFNVATF